jgi:tetratricopeptide (TPR) repeat protein
MRYELALSDLGAYYDQIGAVQKQQWVEEEMNNLREAHAATIQGTADVDVAAPAPDDVASEQMLVENVMDARRGYRTAMDTLAQLYERQGNTRKALIVHTMQNRFHPEETHAYMVTVALPPKDLEPSELIPEANALFDRAEELHEEGALIPAAADYDKERRALELFQSLIRRYPTSTRIPMAAFYIAEIYKEYFGEHYLSTLWYERAWTWDPNIAAPARFQCALQYDIHINDYRTAVDLYRASIEHEPYYPSHVRFAQRRIEEIQEYLANRGELERRPALPEGQVRQLPQ